MIGASAAPTTQPLLREVDTTGVSDLADLAALMRSTFADPNIVLDAERLREFLASNGPEAPRRFFVVVAREMSNHRLVGGVVFSYVRRSNCGFSEYIVTAPQARGRGIGRLLFEHRKELLDTEARATGHERCHGVFIEVENPERTPAVFVDLERQSALDAWDRWRVFDHFGFRRLSLRYVQPPLGPAKVPVDYMDLMFLPWDAVASSAARIPASWILETIRPLWSAWAPREHAAIYDDLLRSLGGRDVRLMPLFASTSGEAPSRDGVKGDRPMAAATVTSRAVPSLTTAETRRLQQRFVPASFYQANPIVVAQAHGARIVDPEGKEYIDFAAGIASLNLGHGHPEVQAAVMDQLTRYGHQGFHVASYDGYVLLAQELDRIFPADVPTKSILVNSGAEAVENAIKVARAATGREYVIAFQNSFHGRTELALTATGKTKPSRVTFLRSMSPHVLHAPYPYAYRPLARWTSSDELSDLYVRFIERMLDTQIAPEHVAAILAEPIQGEGGVVVPPQPFFQRLRKLCDQHGILLIADEVQTGMGRTGTMFGIEQWGAAPDIVTTAKALASGFPLGAVTARADLMDRLPLGSVGSTFGGHPAACAAALKTIEVIERDGLIGRARAIGVRIRARFDDFAEKYQCVGDVRGVGAMQAIELVKDRATKEPAPELLSAIAQEACDRGLVTMKAGLYANVLRALVPLTISDEDLEEGLVRLDAAIGAAVARLGVVR